MELVERKLLTIVVESALESRLITDLGEAGIRGYTVTTARGAGVRGQGKVTFKEATSRWCACLAKTSPTLFLTSSTANTFPTTHALPGCHRQWWHEGRTTSWDETLLVTEPAKNPRKCEREEKRGDGGI